MSCTAAGSSAPKDRYTPNDPPTGYKWKMSNPREEDIRLLAERAMPGCAGCAREGSQILALTALEHAVPERLQHAELPGDNTGHALKELYEHSLDQARHGQWLLSAHALMDATSLLSERLTDEDSPPTVEALKLLIALVGTSFALGDIAQEKENQSRPVEALAFVLSTETHLTAQALVLLDRPCRHAAATAQN